jgi:hypothetical protein
MQGRSESNVTREWAIHGYKARLDSAIAGERWDEADRVRVAAKRRLIEMVAKGGGEREIAAARDALADSFDRLRLSKRVRIDKGALATATRLSADSETAGIAAEQAPLPADTARDVKERILQILSSGNRRPWSTSDLATETTRRVETVARAVSQLRAERKIVSRRIGRNVLHCIAEPQREPITKVLRATVNAPVHVNWSGELLAERVVLPIHFEMHGGEHGPAGESLSGPLDCVGKAEPRRGAEWQMGSLRDLLDTYDVGPAPAAEKRAIIETKMPLVTGA